MSYKDLYPWFDITGDGKSDINDLIFYDIMDETEEACKNRPVHHFISGSSEKYTSYPDEKTADPAMRVKIALAKYKEAKESFYCMLRIAISIPFSVWVFASLILVSFCGQELSSFVPDTKYMIPFSIISFVILLISVLFFKLLVPSDYRCMKNAKAEYLLIRNEIAKSDPDAENSAAFQDSKSDSWFEFLAVVIFVLPLDLCALAGIIILPFFFHYINEEFEVLTPIIIFYFAYFVVSIGIIWLTVKIISYLVSSYKNIKREKAKRQRKKNN